ncbi:MAG: transposase [Gammaproteobacteria bacterium]|nr:transposase [Gammaproteobacteria bacterium]
MKGHYQLRKGRCSLQNQIYHVSTATHGWQPLFQSFRCGRAVVDCMRHEHDAGHVKSLAFVVMPDHLHWLFSLTGSRSLSESIKNVKAFSARRINEILRSKGAIWQPAFYDRAIRREEDLEGVARYIVANPLRAGIVRTIKEYPLWDANWV